MEKPIDSKDALLACLEALCKQQKQPFSAQAVTAGLPLVEGKLTPTLFVRAAERVKFDAKIHKVSIKKIDDIPLPAVLILKQNKTAILYKISTDKKKLHLSYTSVAPAHTSRATVCHWLPPTPSHARRVRAPSTALKVRAKTHTACERGSSYLGMLQRFREQAPPRLRIRPEQPGPVV